MDINTIVKHFEVGKDRVLEYMSNPPNVRELAKITSISIAVYYIARKLYIGFFGPLAGLPGPFITRFMSMPSLKYTLFNGKRYQLLKLLHEKYGHIVRTSPDVVSISDKNMIKQALHTDDLVKAPFYDGVSLKSGPNLFSTRNKSFHKQRRRIAAPAFSIKYLNSLEPFVLSVTQSFLEKISKDIESSKDSEGYGEVDIWTLYQCLGLDVIGETAFGQTFEMIEHNNHFVPKVITEEMKSSAINGMFPTLAKLFFRGSTRLNPKLQQFMQEIVNKRSTEQGEKRKDILQWLIDTQNAEVLEDRLTSDDIIAETVLFLIAGSETTSNTLGFAVYELLRNPDKLRKLYNEIDQVPLEEGKKLFNHEQLKNLPYLNAVINETLRMDAVASIGLARITTRKTVFGGQYVIPKDIIVISNIYVAQTSDEYWDNPEEFIPERWLPEETNVKQADNEAFYPFSLGTRNCIGKNFALQEMRVSLAALLKYYEIAPIEKELKEAEERKAYITLGVANNSFNIRAKHRSH